MRGSLARFFIHSSGAVSVEMTVVTAACVGLTVAALATISQRTDGLGDQVGQLVEATIVTGNGDPAR